MERTKQKELTERLPATPCTPQMRDGMIRVAKARNKSIAELQREAVALFLSRNDTSNTEISTKITKGENQ